MSEPRVTVECDGDGCGETEEFGLTSLAGRGWDDRDLDAALRRAGWAGGKDDAHHYCIDCRTAKEAAACS